MNTKDRALLTYLQDYLTPQRYQRLEDVLSHRTRHFTVALENVFQDRNEGAIIRTCDCFGIQDIHLIDSQPIEKVTHTIARGAEKWITPFRYESDLPQPTERCLQHLRNKGYRIVATSPHEKGVALNDFDVSTPAAFVFGTEDTGISDHIMEEADEFVHIPMHGFTESFNVSVAASILLQNVTARVKNSSTNWELPSEEREELRLEWTKKSIKYIDSLLIDFEKKYA